MKKWASENLSGLIEELECQCRHGIDIIDISRPMALWHPIKIGAFKKTRISHLKCCMSKITGLRGPRYGTIQHIAKESARSTGRVLQTATHKRAAAICQPEGGWKDDSQNSGWSTFCAAFCEQKIKILFRVPVSGRIVEQIDQS